jgi:uncharacterized protein
VTWSRYNHLFQSERFGGFLYNALSNQLLELDDAHYHALEQLRDADGDGADDGGGGIDEDFLAVLREVKVLVAPGDEEGVLLAHRYAIYARHFETTTLSLTVCPTLACNFRCPYCFEHDQADGTRMSAETVERLVGFIASYADIRRLSISWYGGEPTLAWDVVCDITERVLKLDLACEHAGLVTNGYLLGPKKIAQLNDLGIGSVQITLDGPREVHDRRRVLAGGGPTYDRILENVKALMDSSYEGVCSIRVNVDKSNVEDYVVMRAELLERFAGKKLFVYAGHVHVAPERSCEHPCSFDGREWSDFTLGLYRDAGLLPTRGFYPSSAPEGCVANAHHGFVVGPRGELYKCWEDVGKPQMEVGDLHAEEPITNPALRARYAIGTGCFEDPTCLECRMLPVCGGGCPNKRLRALQFGETGLEYCLPYRDDLESYLEAYYDTLLTREICAAMLVTGAPEKDGRGYRVVSPQPRPTDAPDPLAGPVGRED